MRRHSSSAAAAAVLSVLAAPSLARAATIEITGIVTSISNNTSTLAFDSSVSSGVPFTETYTYDPGLPDDFAPDPTYGHYSPISSYSITFGDYTFFDSTAGGDIVVENDYFGHDAYIASNGHLGQLLGSLGGTPVLSYTLLVNLVDNSHSALSSVALLVPDPADFPDQHSARITFFENNLDIPNTLSIEFSIQGIHEVPASVPEPASLTLLILPAASLAFRRMRRAKSSYVNS